MLKIGTSRLGKGVPCHINNNEISIEIQNNFLTSDFESQKTKFKEMGFFELSEAINCDKKNCTGVCETKYNAVFVEETKQIISLYFCKAKQKIFF